MRIARLPLLLALVVSAHEGRAQSRLRNAWDDVRHIPTDAVGVYLAPLHMHKNDLLPIGLTALAFGVALWKDAEIQNWVDAHPHTAAIRALEPFGSEKAGKQIGEVWFQIRLSTALWVLGTAFDSENLRDAGTGCISAGLAQSLPRHYLLYNNVARTRPLATDDPYTFRTNGVSDWNNRSFFSGHSANATTCITFWNERFHMGVLEPVLYTAAIAAGLSRTAERAHWSSDNVLGLAVGYAAGHIVAGRMLRRREKQDSSSTGPGFGQVRMSTDGERVTLMWTIRN